MTHDKQSEQQNTIACGQTAVKRLYTSCVDLFEGVVDKLLDVGAGEFDAVRGHCSSPCLRCNDGHLAAGQGPATPKAKRSGEGQAPVFLIREEWPAGSGEKDRRQPL